jgi:hypothetical protein
MLGNVAGHTLQALQKSGLQIFSQRQSRELNGPGGILDHLHRLDSGNLIEEPAAARVHQHRMPLQLHEL